MTPTIVKEYGVVKFSCGIDGIYKGELGFGKEDVSDTDIVYKTYKTDKFSRILKMVSIASEADKYIHVFAESSSPIMLQCNSEIGTVKIYIVGDE